MNSERLRSLDILRVLSMFLVVVSHYIYHGIKTRPELQDYLTLKTFLGGGNFVSMEALYLFSCVAVNCFVMISGYFLIEKTSYRWRGILKIWIEVFFYSVIFLIATYVTGRAVATTDVLYSVFPIYGQQYWFMTYYFGLMLLAPIIARAMASLSEKQYRIVLLILFGLNFQYLYGDVYGGFASVMWFSFLFMTGGYFNKFGCPDWVNHHKGVLLLGIWLILLLMAIGLNLVKGGDATLVSTSYHGPLFFLSLSVFVFLRLLK